MLNKPLFRRKKHTQQHIIMESSSKKSKNSQNNPVEVKTNAQPDEHRVMKAILEELGVTDYDPQVVTQMLDFSYSYLTDILSDSHESTKVKELEHNVMK